MWVYMLVLASQLHIGWLFHEETVHMLNSRFLVSPLWPHLFCLQPVDLYIRRMACMAVDVISNVQKRREKQHRLASEFQPIRMWIRHRLGFYLCPLDLLVSWEQAKMVPHLSSEDLSDCKSIPGYPVHGHIISDLVANSDFSVCVAPFIFPLQLNKVKPFTRRLIRNKMEDIYHLVFMWLSAW